MNSIQVFLMLRERLSHSLMDGRLLTAAGPSGDDGLRRVLAIPMVREEFFGRVESLFRVGGEVLGLERDPVFGMTRVDIQRVASAIRVSIDGRGGPPSPITLREGVLKIRDLLRTIGSEPLSASAITPLDTSRPHSFGRRAKTLVSMIARAVENELSPLQAGTAARDYWMERLTAEREIIADGMYWVRGAALVHDSIEEVLWALRGLDDVAEITISCSLPKEQRRAASEQLLGGSMNDKLLGVAKRVDEIVTRFLKSRE